jgi:hypothetical protein
MEGEFKVRAVDFEEKPLSEREREHQEQYEASAAATDTQTQEDNKSEATTEKTETTEENPEILELDDNTILSHIKNKFGREVTSLEELLKEQQAQEELPEDVSAFYKYKKETGRGLDDFVKLNRDTDSIPEETLLAEYKQAMNPELDAEDIAYELEQFIYDEDIDSESDIKAAKLAKKKELAKAKEYFNGLKEQYKAPLESRDTFVPDDIKEEFEAFKSNKEAEIIAQEEQSKRSKFFADKTEELFSDKFEGFGFSIDENNKVSYKPADAKEIKEKQSNLQNFIGTFLNDEGYLKDAEKFHRAIAVASDPDKFAKFFYDKGKADFATGFDKESKNIDMLRSGTPQTPNDGPKVRAVNPDSSKGLSFKKR